MIIIPKKVFLLLVCKFVYLKKTKTRGKNPRGLAIREKRKSTYCAHVNDDMIVIQ